MISHRANSKTAPIKTSQHSGFTIIELLIATTIFSLVLLMAVAGILNITRQYYKGVLQARTQEAARTVVEELGETARYSSGNFQAPLIGLSGPDIADGSPDTDSFCLGSRRYTYAIDRQFVSGTPGAKQKRHVLWVDGQCGAAFDPNFLDSVTAATPGRELLSENMRLTQFKVEPVAGLTDTFRITVSVAYGDEDLLEVVSPNTYKTCKVGIRGSEFCTVSTLSVVIGKRLD